MSETAVTPWDFLRKLADWMDRELPNDPDPKIQRDLRVWAQDFINLRARVAELEEGREFASMQIDDLTDRVNNLIESRMEMRGKLATAEAALVEIRDDPDAYHRQIAEDALESTGTREARILRAAEALAREHDDGMDACATCDCPICTAVRGEGVRDE